jgi:hypothetical protein
MKIFLLLLTFYLLNLAPAAQAQDESQAENLETELSVSEDIVADDTMIKELDLKAGGKISIEGENVFAVDDKGIKSPANDGAHELADGTMIETKSGRLVLTDAPAMPSLDP